MGRTIGVATAVKFILDMVKLDDPPKPIIEILEEICLSEGGISNRAAAREDAERLYKKTLQRLKTEVYSLLELGRPPRIAFNSSSDYMVQGACFIEPHDSDSLKKLKAQRLRYSDYYNSFQHLTPEQFESLCGKVIGLLGVVNPVVTRRSADEGIDFYGQLSFSSVLLPNSLTPTIYKQLSVWIVGQAKHYLNIQSGTREIRELVGSIALGRSHTFGSMNDPFSDLNIRAGDPVFAMFMTTGLISANAWRLLKRSGIVGIDGEMIAAFLADNNAGMSGENFDSIEFIEWIEN